MAVGVVAAVEGNIALISFTGVGAALLAVGAARRQRRH